MTPSTTIFEWIEALYNPVRRHTSIGDLSPVEFEALHTAAESCGIITTNNLREFGSISLWTTLHGAIARQLYAEAVPTDAGHF